MEKVKLTGDLKVDIKAIAEVELNGDFGTFEKLVQTPWGFVKILIYEEFYFRIGSDLSVTIIYEEKSSETEIEIISAGGKDGIQGVSFGAEKKALTGITRRLIKEGFTLVEGEYAGMERDEKRKQKEDRKKTENESK